MEPVNSEKLGETCMDGGTCHHKESCTERCFRRQFCSPLTLAVDAGLTMDKWRYPDDPAKAPGGLATGISLWQTGVGLSWDVFAYGERIARVVSQFNIDAQAIHQALVGAGYAETVDVRPSSDSPVIGNPISGGITDTQVEAATMALVGFGTDPAPGTDWFACRSWRINKVRALMRKALEVAARTK